MVMPTWSGSLPVSSKMEWNERCAPHYRTISPDLLATPSGCATGTWSNKKVLTKGTNELADPSGASRQLCTSLRGMQLKTLIRLAATVGLAARAREIIQSVRVGDSLGSPALWPLMSSSIGNSGPCLAQDERCKSITGPLSSSRSCGDWATVGAQLLTNVPGSASMPWRWRGGFVAQMSYRHFAGAPLAQSATRRSHWPGGYATQIAECGSP